MAIQWADNFGRYGTGTGSRTAMLAGLPYSNIGTTNGGVVEASPDPNDDQRSFKIGSNGNDWPQDFRISLPTVVTSGLTGVLARIWLDRLPASNNERAAVLGFQRANGDYLAYVRVEQNGALTIHARVSGVITQLFDSVNPVISPSSFNHYEFTYNRSTGAGGIYINGVLRGSYTGADFGDNVVFVNCSNRTGSGVSLGAWYKDLVIWDATGTQNNTAPMGTVIVRRLNPNGDVTLGDWVPSTGSTGFNLLNKSTPNDTTFLSADSTSPNPMTFNLENLPPDITSVRGLVKVHRSRKVDGGDANIQTGISPNGTTWDNGADRPITSAFSYYFDISELDPVTAAPWTPVGVDSATFRIDRTV